MTNGTHDPDDHAPRRSRRRRARAADGPPVRTWCSHRLDAVVESAMRRLARADDVVRVAIMPDVHPSSSDPASVCVGTVLATRRVAYPGAVGGDIGCGILTAAFHVAVDSMPAQAGPLLKRLGAAIPTTKHASLAACPSLSTVLAAADLSDHVLERTAQRDGRIQLGTLGRGNHFVELQGDEEGRLWIMIHSGSRAMGQAIRDHHLARALGRREALGGRRGLTGLDTSTDAGAAYLNDVAWARRYAAASRRHMLDAAAAAIRATIGGTLDESTVHDADHNHLSIEPHFDEDLIVHRKGAQSAALGEPGAVPGSMGTMSVHIVGRGEPESLRSCSHGAGRSVSRDEAARRVNVDRLRDELGGTLVASGSLHRLRAEAPSAYKDLRDVMRAQRDLARVVRTLRPVLVHKGE